MFDKKKDAISGYIDPVADFTNRELKLSEWYVRHKILLERIFIGTLVLWSVVTFGFTAWQLGSFFISGYSDDLRLQANMVSQVQNYRAIQPLYEAQDLRVFQVRTYEAAADRYTFAARVVNPNEQHIARLTYHFTYRGGDTEIFETTLLPQEDRPVAVFGEEVSSFPSRAQFVLDHVSWERVDTHKIPSPKVFMEGRRQFEAHNLDFVLSRPSAGIYAHTIAFMLVNDSAYSFWEPKFYVELLDGESVVGLLQFPVKRFIAGEERPIDIRSTVDELFVGSIRLYPLVNVFEDDVYIKPGE